MEADHQETIKYIIIVSMIQQCYTPRQQWELLLHEFHLRTQLSSLKASHEPGAL